MAEWVVVWAGRGPLPGMEDYPEQRSTLLEQISDAGHDVPTSAPRTRTRRDACVDCLQALPPQRAYALRCCACALKAKARQVRQRRSYKLRVFELARTGVEALVISKRLKLKRTKVYR
ncbi:MAG: hypothetical protein VW405_21780, partial [Rhodospirillaceae bacterium]